MLFIGRRLMPLREMTHAAKQQRRLRVKYIDLAFAAFATQAYGPAVIVLHLVTATAAVRALTVVAATVVAALGRTHKLNSYVWGISPRRRRRQRGLDCVARLRGHQAALILSDRNRFILAS
jgi:hypothetical protein